MRRSSTTTTRKYYSLTGHLIIPEILVMSKKVWNELSAEDQALIMKVAKEAQREQRELWEAKEQESLDDDEGRTASIITEVSPEEKQRFQDAMKPVYEKHAADLRGADRAHPGSAIAVGSAGAHESPAHPPIVVIAGLDPAIQSVTVASTAQRSRNGCPDQARA